MEAATAYPSHPRVYRLMAEIQEDAELISDAIESLTKHYNQHPEWKTKDLKEIARLQAAAAY